jgi:hypothetical protein
MLVSHVANACAHQCTKPQAEECGQKGEYQREEVADNKHTFDSADSNNSTHCNRDTDQRPNNRRHNYGLPLVCWPATSPTSINLHSISLSRNCHAAHSEKQLLGGA